ncbi:MAG: ABC transporter permease [Bacteriovoracia bacterium]
MTGFALNWQQIKVLTFANMKARYRKTFIGFVWVVLNPILMFSVQALVFKKFLQIDHPDYYLFLLGGLLPWIFINSAWETCTTTIANSSQVIKSFQISPFVILASALLDCFVNFAAAFLIMVIPTLMISQKISASLFLLPISVGILVLFTVASTTLFSVLHVFYRDIKYVTHFAMSLLFFLTPIFYPPDYVPHSLQWIINLNPIYLIIAPFRSALYGGSMQEILAFQFKGLLLSLIFLGLFLKLWQKKKNELFLKL